MKGSESNTRKSWSRWTDDMVDSSPAQHSEKNNVFFFFKKKSQHRSLIVFGFAVMKDASDVAPISQEGITCAGTSMA